MSSPGLSRFAPLVLRVFLGGVYLWFGISQLTTPSIWTSMIPEWAMNFTGMSADTIVYLNGWFEVVAGSLLILGLFVRVLAFILSAHLFVISYELGLNAVGVRDIGLAGATLALALFGAGEHSLSAYIKNRRTQTELNA